MNPEEERPVVDLDTLGAAEPVDVEPEPVAEPEPESDAVGEVEAVAEPEAVAEAVAEVPADSEPAPDSAPGAEAQGDQGDDEDDPGLVAMDRSLPDLTEDAALESALEALLLVVDSPASEESLAEAVDQPAARVTGALRTMAERFTERASGIDLRRVGEGWRFFTRDTYAPFVEKLLLDGQRSKLTRAALETLAVIAYRQPVTRSRVAAVRGVNVDGVIRTLLARGLIEEAGTDPETGGTLYVTTELFLERLGLPSLNDLPPIAPLLPEVDAIDDI
ncbi:SMC-Scp complex subunit ScpB [Amycolatopsis acidiphila]|uniref:SMC-Scp complex subunit ScpB n=1 Tax=Amycolatopsis acidiphila TaxID=715473 RepID=A0A558A4U3_9PSEU|nr:SMC-Scp complex subunit ScpB [Amycolatopsis acidiphila]TVT19275.1 SMC-Scp complex subunit ScpB [Amycolatopsis acidiphila]UIJ62298.1 SMC-Scp complex subunit ScpB [Amycolatopsis acidiphila]GHG96716.1 segregation and condensation protein B [Amycolatopsis acidiphila]